MNQTRNNDNIVAFDATAVLVAGALKENDKGAILAAAPVVCVAEAVLVVEIVDVPPPPPPPEELDGLTKYSLGVEYVIRSRSTTSPKESIIWNSVVADETK